MGVNTLIFSLGAGFLAALASYFLNSRALKLIGDRAVVYSAPIFEETLKTGLAFLLSGSVLISHMTFGMIEAIHDFYRNQGLMGILSAGAGFLSHSLFGLITVLAPRIFKAQTSGIISAMVIHMAWNYSVINIRLDRYR